MGMIVWDVRFRSRPPVPDRGDQGYNADRHDKEVRSSQEGRNRVKEADDAPGEPRHDGQREHGCAGTSQR